MMAISDKHIFDAVLKVWNEQGIAHTTLRRIGEAAELGELTLIRRFGTRDKLIFSAFEKVIEELQEAIVPTGDLKRDVGRVIEILTPVFRSRGRLVLDLLLESSRRNDARAMVFIALPLVNRIGGILEQYQSAGLMLGSSPWGPLLALVGPLFLNSFNRDFASTSPYVLPTIEEFLNGWSAPKARPD